MKNEFNKGYRRPTIFEEATAYDNGNCGYIKPYTNVVVKTNRLWYGNKSTASAFLATAYDEQGNRIDSMNGYFLEPEHNPDSARVGGGKKAIEPGIYNIIPKETLEKRINKQREKEGKGKTTLRFEWYVDSVPGRSGIAIHNGNVGDETEGCLLPGTTVQYDKKVGQYRVDGSDPKRRELFDFFKKYGRNGIKIEVGM